MAINIDFNSIERIRLNSLIAEINAAERALADPTTPDHVKHFYSGQLPTWRERYAAALKEIEEAEKTNK